MAPPPLDVYHERQQLSRCAVHAVNHLLGGAVYSASVRRGRGMSHHALLCQVTLFVSYFSLVALARVLLTRALFFSFSLSFALFLY